MEGSVRIIRNMAVFTLLLAAIDAAPKKSNVAVENYQNQRLPDVPGYIPVYIKQEEPSGLKSNPVKPKHKIKQEQKSPEHKRTEVVHHHFKPTGLQHNHKITEHPRREVQSHGHKHDHSKHIQQHHTHRQNRE